MHRRSILALAALAAAAYGQQPTLRNKPAMAFDAARNRLVVFGGFYDRPKDAPREPGSPVREDTWEWDGIAWERVSATGPAPRAVAAMVFDSRRKKIVLFGGEGPNAEPFGDTWEWDGKHWEPREAAGPSARSVHDMAYEAHTGRVILFGGWQGSGKPMFGDTWAWDGQRWSEIKTPGPAPRMFHTMAYDEKRRAIILFGGADISKSMFAMGDTWIFKDDRWSELPGPGPMGRDHHAMAYYSARGKIVLFGGGLMVDRRLVNLGDTWEWDGSWHNRTDLAAPGRSGKPNLSYDPNSKQLWLYGGYNETGMIGDLWRFDGSKWRPAPKAAAK